MLEETLQSLGALFSPDVFLFFFIPGIIIGIIFGVLPGIGGMSAMVILLPYVTMMTPTQALALLLAIGSVSVTGGSITSILFGIPGDNANAPTILDGFPLTKKGRAAYAIGASVGASGLGGVAGAVIMYALIPVVKPIILSFGPPEFLLLILLGVACIALIGASDAGGMLRGGVSGGLGLLLSLVGTDIVTGELRFTGGLVYLVDGIPLTVAALGVFAIAETISMVASGESIASLSESMSMGAREVIYGFLSVFRHLRAFTVGTIVGTIIGIVPGVGGNASTWVAYGFSKQFSKRPETYGQGNVEGVIAPEASANAKEGGALLTTLAFGIPGSVQMTIILVLLTMKGIEVGPRMLTQHSGLVYTMIWVVALANVVAAVICGAFARPLAKITFLRLGLLVPILLTFVAIGAISSKGDLMDLVGVFFFGIVGYFMKTFKFSRAALVVGLILGSQAERNLQLSIQMFGPTFMMRPISLVILALLVGLILWTIRGIYMATKAKAPSQEWVAQEGIPLERKKNVMGNWLFTGAVVFFLAWCLLATFGYTERARLVPLGIGVPTLLMVLAAFAQGTLGPLALVGGTTGLNLRLHKIWDDLSATFSHQEVNAMLWMLVLPISVLVLGYVAGIAVFCFLAMVFLFREKLTVAAAMSIVLFAITYGMLNYVMPGLLVYGGVFDLL